MQEDKKGPQGRVGAIQPINPAVTFLQLIDLQVQLGRPKMVGYPVEFNKDMVIRTIDDKRGGDGSFKSFERIFFWLAQFQLEPGP